ncbi:hypothetical protein AB0P10_24930 [Streptomyces parvus]|uniref:hypothetical protein n=1 Tax=Streptomyces parvus TaxID=66428 RepID=UPI003425BB9D
MTGRFEGSSQDRRVRVQVDRLARRERQAALREMAEAKDEVFARRAERAARWGK